MIRPATGQLASPHLALVPTGALPGQRDTELRCIRTQVAHGLPVDEVCARWADRHSDEMDLRAHMGLDSEVHGAVWTDDRGDVHAWWTRDPEAASAAADAIKADPHLVYERLATMCR